MLSRLRSIGSLYRRKTLALYPSSFLFVLDIAYAPMNSNQISLQRFSLHLSTCVAFPFFDIVPFQRKRVPRYRSDRRPLLKNLQLEIPHCRIFPRVENRPISFTRAGIPRAKVDIKWRAIKMQMMHHVRQKDPRILMSQGVKEK